MLLTAYEYVSVFLLSLGSWVLRGAGKGKEKLGQLWVESLGNVMYIQGRLTATVKEFSEGLGVYPIFAA